MEQGSACYNLPDAIASLDVYKRQPLIPQTCLERIYRQSEESTIVTLASQIRQGILPADFTQKKADRSYFEIASGHIPATIEKILGAALRSGIPARDIQVLAPMYRGCLLYTSIR